MSIDLVHLVIIDHALFPTADHAYDLAKCWVTVDWHTVSLSSVKLIGSSQLVFFSFLLSLSKFHVLLTNCREGQQEKSYELKLENKHIYWGFSHKNTYYEQISLVDSLVQLTTAGNYTDRTSKARYSEPFRLDIQSLYNKI